MRNVFIAQPDRRLGDFLDQLVNEKGPPDEFTVVSAFVSLPAALRIKTTMLQTSANGGVARLVVGVDLGGTSKQVLQELAGWTAQTFVIKNAVPAVTFHPKIYYLCWAETALIAVGSSNLTDGGLFRNFEATTCTIFDLPADAAPLADAVAELTRFLNPSGPTAKELTPGYLADLVALPEIPSESETRRRRGERRTMQDVPGRPLNVFGREDVPATPVLPPELQALLLAARRKQVGDFESARRRAKAVGKIGSAAVPPAELEAPLAVLDATYFYITLPSMKADNPRIPGEMRIPLEALEIAPDFWGWPDLYERREDSPRAGASASEVRIYTDRRARWRTTSVSSAAPPVEADVRMYVYDNSSDFRMMIGALNQFGGKKGDIIRVCPISSGPVSYECVLAPAGTAEHTSWSSLLVNPVRASDRLFGYA